MTLRAFARCSAVTFTAAHRAQVCVRTCRWQAHHRTLPREQGGTVLDARRMSYSISASSNFAARPRSSDRKAFPNHVFGGAAVTCLVLGCAWTLYANVFGASVYPQLSSATFDSPVTKRPALAARSAPSAASNILAALPEPVPVISAPASVPSGPSLSFDDRFAAAAPQGVEPKARAEPPKLAEAA